MFAEKSAEVEDAGDARAPEVAGFNSALLEDEDEAAPAPDDDPAVFDTAAEDVLPAGDGLDVDFLQRVGIELELRIGFENDVILVELGVESVDLALSEGVVERVVDGLRRDAEAGGGSAIDDQRFGLAVQLLVGRHVGQVGAVA